MFDAKKYLVDNLFQEINIEQIISETNNFEVLMTKAQENILKKDIVFKKEKDFLSSNENGENTRKIYSQ